MSPADEVGSTGGLQKAREFYVWEHGLLQGQKEGLGAGLWRALQIVGSFTPGPQDGQTCDRRVLVEDIEAGIEHEIEITSAATSRAGGVKRRIFLYSLLTAAALMFIGRIFITPRLVNIPSTEGSFESLSHLIEGFFIGIPFYDWKQRLGPARLYGLLGAVLAIWELGWFLCQRFL